MKCIEHMTEPELRELMQSCGAAIGEVLHNRFGYDLRPKFALVLFNDPRGAQYISSCHREDMIKALRETADRLERRQDVPR